MNESDRMTDTIVASRLCNRDRRNPMWEDIYGDYEDPPKPRRDCFCDNCFYGRDAMALEIIRLRNELERFQ